MPSFEVTQRGANGLEVGKVVEFDELPAWLVGKCREVPQPKTLEVATPQRGRPPKEK